MLPYFLNSAAEQTAFRRARQDNKKNGDVYLSWTQKKREKDLIQWLTYSGN